MNRPSYLLLTALALPIAIALTAAAQTGQTAQTTATPPAKPANTKPAQQGASTGERVFNQNCSRCHTAPEQLRPSITGTVVRHMRVRASLSAADEKALLQFLAP